ncbi:hypothetical protein BIU82_14565 [Arthrobacter sp. SW1]|uniref:hypothetical protein n=1 Tax=Arthrobacter sp. SW1 TaxID=1920889 RepID=UPI000877B7BF|nr:hypothetical protein [Arthrobacter sp. SW1]OFI39316.1 hypothetical protein BIU82_14565 [Arthrobacter sp. SW1]
MQDTNNAGASFREIDEHGNAVPHEPLAAPEETRKFQINPFIVALWVLDAALMLLVGWALGENFGPAGYGIESYSGPTPLFLILMGSIPQILPVPLVMTTALLFWHAWQWQKRRAS